MTQTPTPASEAAGHAARPSAENGQDGQDAPIVIRARNPRTGICDYEVAVPNPSALGALCTRLRSGQLSWLSAGLDERIARLQRFRDALAARGPLLAALIADTGRRSESELELRAALSTLDRVCSTAASLGAAPELRPSTMPGIAIARDTVPYSLVGVISPWNFPLLLSLIDTAPALVAGCAVVVKPSEMTPRFIAPMQDIIGSVPGLRDVLCYVPGDGTIGSAIADQVDLVCFTGSVATGRAVAERCGRRLIPAYLELGGKDPAIVTRSADLDRATSALLWGSVVNAGQSCLSIERIYVDNAIMPHFVEMLVTKAQALRLAYPDFDSGHIGPIIAARQAAVIEDHLRDARQRGARVLCGGEIEEHGGGLYCRPTVLVDVDHSMKLMREESFAPFMPVMPFTDLDEAVRLANDSDFGLSAAVFAGSTEEALAIGRRLFAGAVSINDAGLTALVHDAEKNAFRASGLGPSRMGPSAISRFWRRQAHLIQTATGPNPWWY